MNEEFMKMDPSFYADLVSNLNQYQNRLVNDTKILIPDACIETFIEKEYLEFEK